MPNHNVKLIIAYDGTAYLGWQKTECGPSIEEELQKVLEQVLQEKITLQAASRTDAGVHAQGQIVNFFTEKDLLHLDKLRCSLNSLLPKDIVVLEAVAAQEKFHPTLNCTGKEYRYSICTASVQMPHHRFFSWHFPAELDLKGLNEAAQLFVGRHDFSALCNFKKNANYTDYIREIRNIFIEELPEKRLQIRIQGNHFLYKMVRNIVGTLVYVACGKMCIEEIPEILLSKDRTKAGVTAPAHGLSLHKVYYGDRE